jgi:hypothetical protein
MKNELKWNNVNDIMPEKNKYVLVETRFCKYPFITGYFNGINWINCDDKTIIKNIEYWADIKTPISYCQAQIEGNEKCESICNHCHVYYNSKLLKK